MISAPPAPRLTIPARPRKRVGRAVVIVLVVLAVAVCLAVVLGIRYWPFEQKAVIENLAESSDSQVQVRSFRKTYFPHPGCTMEGLVFIHGSHTAQPLITIEKLTIQATYAGLLERHVRRMVAEGMRIVIPPLGEAETFHTSPTTIFVDEIVANGATLEFDSGKSEKQALRFDIHEAVLRDVGWKGPMSYQVKVHNPEPPGEVTASGKFGVWNENAPEQTPLSGEYKFDHADLSVYHGVAGMLSSQGKFGGKLGHIDVSGTTDTPNFEVTSGGHPVRLTSEFTAYVDGTNGDTFLKRVDAQFKKTHVVATGSIAKSANGKGKTALLDLKSRDGRIEDMLGLFTESARAPMSGAVTMRAKVEIPPSDRPFLEKIKLLGSFGIDAGEFTQSSTQEGVNKLSAGARGEKDSTDPETALTDLTGRVALTNGVANFTELSFGVPGANARMQGTYNLISYKIDLHGQMQVDTKISNTTTGAKALLLKVMDPFFKKRKKGEILPVRISGTYHNPSFGLDLNDKKAQQVAAPSGH